MLATPPDLDPRTIDEVVWGNANGAGEENRNVGRMAVLLAGLPVTLPATTVNRLCGSSLDAAMIASRHDRDRRRRHRAGRWRGVDDPGPVGAAQAGPAVPAGRHDRGVDDARVAAGQHAMPAEWTVSLGEATKQLQEKYAHLAGAAGRLRARSHQLADAAWNEGFYDDLTVAVPGTEVTRDETIRPGTTAGEARRR